MPEPSTPEGSQEPRSSTDQPTAPIPPAGPPTQPMPSAEPHAGPAPGAGPAPHSGPAPGVATAAGVAPQRPGIWKQATSTTGGLIAVILACGLAVVLLLGLVGTGLLVATRIAAHDDRGERTGVVRGDREDQPPGLRKKLEDKRPGPRDDGQGRGGNGLGNGMGNGMGMDNGLGPLMRAATALGNVQHGEFTVTDEAGKPKVMILQRGEVTKVSGTSISVKSADNFAGTYAMDATTAGRAGNAAVGDSVLVVAEKAGAKAVLVAASRRG